MISGLSGGILVVEAAARSGSLITAKAAIDQGRDVFAIPGSIHSPLSRGCHELIRQGAKLVESSQDILEELKHFQDIVVNQSSGERAEDEFSDEQKLILAQMGYDPVDADILSERCDMDAASLSVELLNLELSGNVESLPGGFYRRLAVS